MSWFKDRHLVGAGAAACAVCCAAPLLTVLGVAGAAATIATFMFAGVVFGLVVAAATALAVWRQRRLSTRPRSIPGPVDVPLSVHRRDE
jgi:hypothetical protein